MDARARAVAHLRSALVVACLNVIVAGCGGKDSSPSGPQGSAGDGPIPACPDAMVLEPTQIPCLIGGESCGGAGRCEDPRQPFTIGCPGYVASECDGDSACDPGQVCVAGPTCGPAMQCVPPCTASSCGPDEQCGSDGKCAPLSCVDGYTCAADWRCAATRTQASGLAYDYKDVHGCSPASCVNEGFTCPPGTRCDPSTGGNLNGCNPPRCDKGGSCPQDTRCGPADNSHPDGCLPLRCTIDSDCDCGACLMGQCAYQPGICVPQLL